jgi:hypothetical protein
VAPGNRQNGPGPLVAQGAGNDGRRVIGHNLDVEGPVQADYPPDFFQVTSRTTEEGRKKFNHGPHRPHGHGEIW